MLGVDLRASRRQQEEREGRDTAEQTSGAAEDGDEWDETTGRGPRVGYFIWSAR